MKKHLLSFTLVILIILFFTSSLLEAQDTTAAAKPLDGVDRCWGMNFMWKKDFTLGKQKIDSYPIYNGESSQTNNWVTGFGLDWYLSNRVSLNLIGSIGTDNESSSNEGSSNDFNSTELGLKLGFNYYPMGMTKSVYWSAGPWVSYIYYNEDQKYKYIDVEETQNSRYQYTTSKLGFGVNASAYVKPWDALNWEFYAGYNLGVFIVPASTIKSTIGDQTTTTKGPDIIQFHDCGGMVGTRFFFDAK